MGSGISSPCGSHEQTSRTAVAPLGPRSQLLRGRSVLHTQDTADLSLSEFPSAHLRKLTAGARLDAAVPVDVTVNTFVVSTGTHGVVEQLAQGFHTRTPIREGGCTTGSGRGPVQPHHAI